MVRLVELATDAASEGMEERRGRFLRPGRLVERFLRTYSSGTKDRGSALLAPPGGRLLDPLNDGFDPRAELLRRQVLPTGQRRESHGLRRRELARADRLAAVPCRVFLGAIEPEALERFAVQEIADAMDARPVPDTFDQTFFDPVREEIFEPGGLRCLFVADHNGLVPACPDLVGPAGQTSDLPGEVGCEIAHERGELERVVDPEECVHVIAQRDETADPDLVQTLCPARTPRTISLSSRLGTSSSRAWTVRSVTSTRAPPSGMKRMLLDMAGHRESQGACQPAGIAGSPWDDEAYAEV